MVPSEPQQELPVEQVLGDAVSTPTTNVEGSPTVTAGMPAQRLRPAARRAMGHRRSVSVFYEVSAQSAASPTCSTRGTSTLNAHFLNLPEMLQTVLNAPADKILPRERLRLLDRVLGHGSFGEVVYGELARNVSAVECHVDPVLGLPRVAPPCRSSGAATGGPADDSSISPAEPPRNFGSAAARSDLISAVADVAAGDCRSKHGSANTENGCSFSDMAEGTAAGDGVKCGRSTLNRDSDGGMCDLEDAFLASTYCVSTQSSSHSCISTTVADSPQPCRDHFVSSRTDTSRLGDLEATTEPSTQKELSTVVAVKRVDKGRLSKRQQFVVAFHSEVHLSCTLQHPSLVFVHGVAEDETELYLVMEVAEGGTLQEYAKEASAEDLQLTVPRMIAEIVLALEYLRQHGVAHRDIKPCNILLTKDHHVKLADFGSACKIDDPAANTFGGTVAYMAPEVVKTGKATSTSDLWSLGCVVFELFASQTPIQGKTHVLMMSAIKEYQNGSIAFPETFPTDAQNLVQLLLRCEPCDRLGSDETGGFESLKKHDFFANVDWAQYNCLSKPGP